MKVALLRLFHGCLALVSLFVALLAADCSYDDLSQLRRMEKLPMSRIGALLEGVRLVEGFAVSAGEFVTAPRTGVSTLYYHYTIEREERDSEGKTRWVTEHEERAGVAFDLADDTGAARIATLSGTTPTLSISHQSRSGDRRYTEYRIDEETRLTVLGEVRREGAHFTLHTSSLQGIRPFVTGLGLASERGSVLGMSIFAAILGFGLFAFALYFLFGAFRWHNTTGFAIALNLSLGIGLLYGLRLTVQDLEDSYTRGTAHLDAALGAYANPPTPAVPPGSVLDAEEVAYHQRIESAYAAMQHNRARAAWPERWFARLLDVPEIDLPPLSAEEEGTVWAEIEELPPLRIPPWIGWIAIVVGGALAAWMTRAGLRAVHFARLVEGLPTTPLRGLTYGLNEAVATLQPAEGHAALHGPVSTSPCCWYRYVVSERRGSGKNASWVVIEDRTEACPIDASQEGARVRVYLEGAEIWTRHLSSRRQGKRMYREERLAPGDEVYVLGAALIDPHAHDRLAFQRDPGADTPFFVANYGEDEVLYRKARSGMLLWAGASSVGLSATFVLACSLFGVTPLGYLAAVSAGPFYLLLLMTLLLYNDLVFLRERCERNRANIDVSLKKRFDLIQQLVPVIRAAAAHEKETQALVARARQEGRVEALAGSVLALAEAYPELQGADAFLDLHRALRDLEDEIALMRQGTLDAIERYNTRRQTLPEAWVARLGRFPAMAYSY